MKKFYSEYPYGVMRKYAKQGIIADRAVSLDRLTSERNKLLGEGAAMAEATSWALLVAAEREMLAGNGVDYFIESLTLTDLIVGMVGEVTTDLLDIFAETRETAFVIHPPSPRPAVICGLRTSEVGTSVTIRQAKDSVVRWFGPGAFRGRESFSPDSYSLRLVFGLALYTRFFPKAVHEGIPEDAKHPSHYKGQPCRTLSVDPRMIDRSSPCPHLRKAHVRFLASEKFVHKKGTFVLVAPTMVKGKSKIVLEVEQ